MPREDRDAIERYHVLRRELDAVKAEADRALGTGERLRELHVDGDSADVYSLLDKLAIDILRTVLRREGRNADAERVELASKTTRSLSALKSYLQGEALYQQSRFNEAARAYERALQADSTFALMFSRFLGRHSFVAQATPQSVGAALPHALRLLDKLPPREALLVRASDELTRENISEAYALLKQASNKYPDDYEVWYSLGEVALHRGGDLLLPPDEAIRAFNNSVLLNPSFGPPYAHLIEVLMAYRADANRTAEVDTAYRRAAPAAVNKSLGSLALAFASGRPAARRNAVAALDTLPLVFVHEIAVILRHPSYRAAQERVFAILAKQAQARATNDE